MAAFFLAAVVVVVAVVAAEVAPGIVPCAAFRRG